MRNKFLGVNDLAERYGVTKQTIFNHVRNGLIPQGFKLGHLRKWTISEIELWEDSQCNKKKIFSR